MPSWLIACLLAPFIGSFAGVVVSRHDSIVSAISGRSQCPTCKTALAARDLVPILSWLWLRARCRVCAAAISPFYPAMEVAALAVALWAAAATNGLVFWLSCGLGWTLLMLAATDLNYFLLPDYLTLPLVAAGLLANAALDWPSVWNYAVGAAAGYFFVLGLSLIYRKLRGRDGIGMGDAKLLAAAGAWVSWWGLPSVIAIGSVLGLLVVAVSSWRGSRIAMSNRVPFGVYLSMGLWIVWIYGPLSAG